MHIKLSVEFLARYSWSMKATMSAVPQLGSEPQRVHALVAQLTTWRGG